MKYLTSLLVLLLAINISGYSQLKVFKFKGQVFAYNQPLKGAKITVILAGDTLTDVITGGSGKFEVELEAEREYYLQVSKDDMRTKLIWVNTKKTQDVKGKIPVFAFDVYLKKEKRTIYDSMAEIPVTLIKYQEEDKEFYMDKTYTSVIKNRKKRIKETGLQRR